MSLTSYRAAPPRVKRKRGALKAPRCVEIMKRIVLDRPGNDLLSRVLRHSTIDAEEFNGRVRDGIGFWLFAQVTGPVKNKTCKLCRPSERTWIIGNDQANRTISTGKLNGLPHLHTRPINVVVFHGSQGSSRFEVGFPLRCIQRLSRPYIATLHCDWRHNRSTRGTSTPVLSY